MKSISCHDITSIIIYRRYLYLNTITIVTRSLCLCVDTCLASIMTKLSAELKTAKYIRRKSKRNSFPKVQTNCSPFRWLIHTLAVSPLLALDVVLSSALWLHTMMFQLTMYCVYIGLFIFCHATGEDSYLQFNRFLLS